MAPPNAYGKNLCNGFAVCKLKPIAVAPLHVNCKNKQNGKSFPKSAFMGAEVWLSNSV